VRAPTPSAAAEVAVPDRQELRGAVEGWGGRLVQLTRGNIGEKRRTLQYREQILRRFSPQAQIDSYRQRIDDVMHSALADLTHRLALARERLRTLDSQLQTLSPLATLERGYAIARNLGTGKVVRSVAQVVAGDRLEVRVSDGQFESTVDHLYRNSGGCRPENRDTTWVD
jgi:exodeoxyribonuclease VII large subunit